MNKQRLVQRMALALAGGMLAAGCAGAGVMPLAGGGVFQEFEEPAIVAQPQMNTTLYVAAHMQAHTTAALNTPYIYFPPNMLCEH